MREIRQALSTGAIDPALLTSAEKLQWEGWRRRHAINALSSHRHRRRPSRIFGDPTESGQNDFVNAQLSEVTRHIVGFRNDGQLILQADHVITRANSATYAETHLIVCVCKGHHG